MAGRAVGYQLAPQGSAVVGGGVLTVDGAIVGTCDAAATPTCESGIYGPGHSLEFVATFTGDPFQHAGLGIRFEDLTPRAAFTTHVGNTLSVRTIDDSGATILTALGTALLGTPHRYRIDWSATGVNFLVDGVLVASHGVVIAGPLRPVAASDFSPFGGSVVVDWMRMTPYATSGSFVSRVFDAHSQVDWKTVTWVDAKPAGTSLAIFVHTGNTPAPDATWSDFAPVAAPGPFTAHSQSIQYRADLTTADVFVTPELSDIIISTDAAPVAVADTASTNDDTPYIFRATGPTRLTVNDTDADTPLSQLRVIGVTAPAHGTATLSNGAVTYTPFAGFVGTDSFTYTITDGLLTASGPVSMSVGSVIEAVNQAPTAVAQSVSTNEDTPVAVTLTGSDLETAPANLTFTIVTPPAHGTLSGTAPNLTYTPAADYTGPDSFTFTVTDRGAPDNCGAPVAGMCAAALTSAAATVSIAVQPLNDAPTATAQPVSTNEDTPVAVTLTGSDLETAPANLTFTIVTPPAHGTLSGTAPNLTYAPAADYSGPDSFTFTVTDRGDPDNCGAPVAGVCTAARTSTAATVSISVRSVNDVPTANAQSVSTNEDTPLAVTLTGSDLETAPANLTFTIATPPAHGTLSGTAPNLTYTPAANYNGADNFTFRVTDRGDPDNCGAPVAGVCAAALTSAAATVSIGVNPVNDTPSFTKGANQVLSGNPGPKTVLSWATAISAGPSDESGQALNFIVAASNTGLFSVQPAVAANGTLTYTPALNVVGTAIVDVQLHDDGGTANGGSDTSAVQTFTITINAAATATSVSTSNSPSPFGVPVTLTAAVVALPAGSGIPAGSVTFSRGTTAIGTAAVSMGVATLTTSTLPVGTHSITAVYAPIGNFAGSTSAAISQVISPSAKLDVTFTLHHISDNTRRPRVIESPVANALIRVFKKHDPCPNGIIVTGRPTMWGEVFENCPVLKVGAYQAVGTTGATGKVTIVVPPTTSHPDVDWIVIGRTLDYDDVRTPQSPDPLYSEYKVERIVADQTRKVRLSQIRLFNGQRVPARAVEEFGSYLGIVEPEYIDWIEEVEQYPFIMVAEGDWDVSMNIAPPSGFVPDETSLGTAVADTTTAVQFTLTDVGSEWTQTSVTHVIKHLGKTRIRTGVVRMINKQRTKAKTDYTTVLPNSTANSIDVLSNDAVAPPKTLTITAVTQGANGSVALAGSEVSYTPNPGFVGVDTFTYSNRRRKRWREHGNGQGEGQYQAVDRHQRCPRGGGQRRPDAGGVHGHSLVRPGRPRRL